MSLLRSEKMSLFQLFLQNETAYQCVSQLGEIGLVQFRDLNPDATPFQRQFTREIRRCNDMERKLRFLEKEITKSDISIFDVQELPLAPQPKEIIDLEATVDKLYTELRESDANANILKENFHSLTEMDLAIQFADVFLQEGTEMLAITETSGVPAADETVAQHSSIQPFNFVTGVVDMERQGAFERMLWRAARGNVYFRRSPNATPLLEDGISGKEMKQVVPFVVFSQGDQLKSRVQKVCEGFHASLYPCPKEEAERKEISAGVLSRLSEMNLILTQTRDHRNRILAAAAKFVRIWTIKVRKIKAIYFTLNMFSIDLASKCLVGECWIPDADIERVCETLKQANDLEISSFEPILTPLVAKGKRPTFHRTNKFTKGFQALVDAYGMADYREINPGLFTIATFPFLFAIMFGDAGHGLFLAIFGFYLIFKEDQLVKVKDEVFRIFIGGRYIIFMMGLFSMYTGLIYNDVFSRSLNIFGSSWKVNFTNEDLQSTSTLMLDPRDDKGHYSQSPYPFGLDPVWLLAENKIVFLNSFKMKLSIIMAVVHMTFGVVLTLFNYVYFKQYSKILVEFLPRIIFFWPLFGYLMSLMIVKWIVYRTSGLDDGDVNNANCAPSILITFINMCMLSYGEEKTTPPDGCDTVFFYENQQTVQTIFLIVAVLAVPVLLFGTPIIYLLERKKKKKLASGSAEDSESAVQSAPSGGHGDDDEEMPFSDVMVYQAIHTIEYVLESISHTASYLRLWALSLAHAQLSEVLWNMVMRIGLGINGWAGGPVIFALFTFWCAATVAILIAMEGMSAFLHTLRLHWVEFQSKFYSGTGVKFSPFSFKRVTDDEED